MAHDPAMTLTHTTTGPQGLDRLRDRFDGEIVTPADPRYDALRRVWNGSIDRYPAARSPTPASPD